MPTIPKSQVPAAIPSEAAPIPTSTLLMAAAQMHEMGRLVQPQQQPFLKRLDPGEHGTPAELYNEYKQQGATKEEARQGVINSLSIGHGVSKEKAEKMLDKQGGY